MHITQVVCRNILSSHVNLLDKWSIEEFRSSKADTNKSLLVCCDSVSRGCEDPSYRTHWKVSIDHHTVSILYDWRVQMYSYGRYSMLKCNWSLILWHPVMFTRHIKSWKLYPCTAKILKLLKGYFESRKLQNYNVQCYISYVAVRRFKQKCWYEVGITSYNHPLLMF